MEAMTPQEIKKLLQKYYDLPAMIAEEQELLEELKKEEGAVSVASPSLAGLPQPKGSTSDPVARAAEHEDKRLEHEIDACRRRIAHYREERAFCTVALATLGRAQRRILELAYLGPKDPQKRRTWVRRPYWKEIAAEVGYSESQTYTIARQALQDLSDLSPQEVFEWESL